MNRNIILVEESLNEFARRGRKPKNRLRSIEGGDAWGGDDEEEGEIDPSKVEIEEEPEDEVGNPNLELGKALDHELKAPEFSRAYIKFKVLGTGEKMKAIPMARMGGGSAYLFKTMKGDLKKVKLTDIILESLNESKNMGGSSILDQLNAEWKPFNVEVDLVEEMTDPEDIEGYGYDEIEGEPIVKYETFNFSSVDDKMDERIQQLGLEILTTADGEYYGQYWYDASPIFSGDYRSLASDPQPWPVANPEEVLEEISRDFEDDEEDE